MSKILKRCVAGLSLLVAVMAQSALTDATADLKQAEELQRKGRHAQAEQFCKGVLNNAAPEQALKAHERLLGIYLAAARQAEAKAAVESLLTQLGDYEFLPHAIHEIVEQARDLSKTREAGQVYRDILQVQPQHPHGLWLKMGVALANVHGGGRSGDRGSVIP